MRNENPLEKSVENILTPEEETFKEAAGAFVNDYNAHCEDSDQSIVAAIEEQLITFLKNYVEKYGGEVLQGLKVRTQSRGLPGLSLFPQGKAEGGVRFYELLTSIIEESTQVRESKPREFNIDEIDTEEERGKRIEEIKELHRLHPIAIFLTQTSTTAFGWIVKEAYRTAWPEEDPPKNFALNVKPIRYAQELGLERIDEDFWKARSGSSSWKNSPGLSKVVEEVKEKLQKIEKDSQDPIVVYDEIGRTGIRGGFNTLDIAHKIVEWAVEDLGLKCQVTARNAPVPFGGGTPWKASHRGQSDMFGWEIEDKTVEPGKTARYKEKDNILIVKKNINVLKEYGRKLGHIIKEEEIKKKRS